jgi:hypothetical protein
MGVEEERESREGERVRVGGRLRARVGWCAGDFAEEEEEEEEGREGMEGG